MDLELVRLAQPMLVWGRFKGVLFFFFFFFSYLFSLFLLTRRVSLNGISPRDNIKGGKKNSYLFSVVFADKAGVSQWDFAT